MAERETLLSIVPSGVRDDADRIYTEGGELDPRDVVAELHRRGLIQDAQLREAVLALEASLRVGRMQVRPPESRGPVILGPLGAGAMGEVLLAKDAGLNRVVAVKRLHGNLAARPAVLQRFYKEAQITAQLDHPGIVPIHGLVDTGDGALAYSMKLVRGRTMEHFIDEARTDKSGNAELALAGRLAIFLDVCDALSYAHDRGVLHRDLKPENIMVGTFGEVLVMDWGIAKVLAVPVEDPVDDVPSPAPAQAGATRVGSVFGTPRYMSPEQALGANDTIDARSDQYTLGLILFELVTLRPAIDPALDMDGCIAWARTGRKQAMTMQSGSVPRELAAIVDKATQLSPDRRYASVAELARDVRRYLRDESVAAKPDSMFQRVQRWVGRHRTFMLMALLSMALFTVVSGSTLLFLGIGALEWRRQVAAAREVALTEQFGQAAAGAAAVEERVALAESLLTGLSFAAEGSVDRPPESTVGLNWDPIGEPPHTKGAGLFGRAISVERPSFVVADGIDFEAVRPDLERLGALSYQFARVLVDSSGRSGDEKLARNKRHELIGNQGVPVVWARVATQNGVLATIPGTVAAAHGPDPRKATWYASARGVGGAAWTGPTVDPSGLGVVMTVALPLFDRGQRWLGSASLDLVVDSLAEALVVPPGATTVYLVDGQGRVVVTPTTKTRKATAFAPPAADPALWAAVKARPEGALEGRGVRAVWVKLGSLGWTYVLERPL